MQLNFEIVKNEVGTGEYPDLIHFANTQAQIFNIDSGKLNGMPSDKIDNGDWDDVTFQDEADVSPDEGMSHFEIKVLPGFGIVGGYKTGDTHKLIIYEFAFEMGAYLNSGSIKHSIDNPISSFALSLENPDLKDPEKPGNVAISEHNSLLSPGAKVIFKFGAGDDNTDYSMGTFYVDRSDFTLLSETASVNGRNKIGKVLKDQTIDEYNEYWYDLISEHIKTILEQSGLQNHEYLISNTALKGWFSFSPNTTPLKAIETMLEVLPSWKIRELGDGTIAVGTGFESNGMYVFYRDKDIFGRQVIRDDAEVYNRVCVHTDKFAKVVYRDVANFQAWSLQAKKTLYIQVADGLKYSDIESYADELALRLESVGRLESFSGPFRPHLMVGDEAVIVDADGSQSLGLITEITHNFGKSGFYTNFTVDSGGTVGRGRLSDFISKIAVASMAQKSDAGWDDIDMTEYFNLSKYADISASSVFKSWSYPELIIDGNKYYDDTRMGDGDEGWMPSKTDTQPWFEIKFKQRVRIDKIKIYLSYDYEEMAEDPEHWAWEFMPNYYKVQYWNGAFWVDLIEVDDVTEYIEFEMTHEFTMIETSAIRFVLRQKLEENQVWREVELWGYM